MFLSACINVEPNKSLPSGVAFPNDLLADFHNPLNEWSCAVVVAFFPVKSSFTLALNELHACSFHVKRDASRYALD